MSKKFGEFEICSTCDQYHFSKEKCAPMFYAWLVEEWGDEITTLEDIVEYARKIYSHGDHDDVAEKCGEYEDGGGDYSIIGGNEAEISVLRHGDDIDKIQTFIVNGETVPSYSARKK